MRLSRWIALIASVSLSAAMPVPTASAAGDHFDVVVGDAR